MSSALTESLLIRLPLIVSTLKFNDAKFSSGHSNKSDVGHQFNFRQESF